MRIETKHFHVGEKGFWGDGLEAVQENPKSSDEIPGLASWQMYTAMITMGTDRGE